jgi:hypothetical protein
VHSKRLGWALAGTTALAGLIFALLSPDGVFAGPAILVMFLLAGFAYMWPTRQVAIFGIFWIKSWIIAAVVLVLYIIPFQGFNLDTSATNIFGPIFGALAAIVFFHVMYQQYSFGKGVLSRFDRSKAPRKRAFDESNAHDVEKRIDEILDKISKGGVRSLSKDEKDFLLKHSENN